MNIFKRTRNYLAEVLAEMKKVSWIKRKELFTTTLVVIVFSVLLAVFIGIFDLIFSRVLSLFLK